METKAFTDFLEALSGNITDGKKALYKSIIETSEIPGFDDWEEFYFAVILPFENVIEGFVRSEIADNSDVAFLFAQSQFIERQFCEMICRKEGSPCSADKSRTILNRLFTFFTTGERIEFDYTGEYTYHLPKQVFTSHDEIVEFYQGVKGLYYGNNERYLKALAAILVDNDEQPDA